MIQNKKSKVEYKWISLARKRKAKFQEEVIKELNVSEKNSRLAAQLVIHPY